MADGCWLLAVGYWLLVTDCWLLVVDCWEFCSYCVYGNFCGIWDRVRIVKDTLCREGQTVFFSWFFGVVWRGVLPIGPKIFTVALSPPFFLHSLFYFVHYDYRETFSSQATAIVVKAVQKNKTYFIIIVCL